MSIESARACAWNTNSLVELRHFSETFRTYVPLNPTLSVSLIRWNISEGRTFTAEIVGGDRSQLFSFEQTHSGLRNGTQYYWFVTINEMKRENMRRLRSRNSKIMFFHFRLSASSSGHPPKMKADVCCDCRRPAHMEPPDVHIICRLFSISFFVCAFMPPSKTQRSNTISRFRFKPKQ